MGDATFGFPDSTVDYSGSDVLTDPTLDSLNLGTDLSLSDAGGYTDSGVDSVSSASDSVALAGNSDGTPDPFADNTSTATDSGGTADSVGAYGATQSDGAMNSVLNGLNKFGSIFAGFIGGGVTHQQAVSQVRSGKQSGVLSLGHAQLTGSHVILFVLVAGVLVFALMTGAKKQA